MSRGCYKAYGRKVNGPTTPSIQFDKIFCENSNKPTASKSAGTVGKWGVTSFTSIRSTNFMIGRRDDGSFKRPRDNKHKESFGLNPPPVPTPEPKPKKFFKSRVVEQQQQQKQQQQPHHKATPPPPPPRQYSSRPPRLASIVASKKLVDVSILDEVEDDDDEIFPTEALTSSYTPSGAVNVPQRAPTPPPAPVEAKAPSPPQPQHPPIVLRIFKGTAQILTDDIVPPKKESRRRSHSSESCDGVSSKRHKSKSKDVEALRRDLEDDDSVSLPKKPVETIVTSEKPVSPVPEPEPPKVEPKEEVEEVVPKEEPIDQIKTTQENDESEPPIDYSCKEETKQTEPTNLTTTPSDPLEIDRIKLLRDLEDDSSLGSGNAVELETKEEPQEASDEFSRTETNKVSVEQDWTSDSESSEVAEKSSVPVDTVVETKPKVSTRPPKKGSIFKSRGGEKRNAHYIHKWCDIKEEGTSSNPTTAPPPSTKIAGEFEFDASTLTRVTNYPDGEPDSLEELEAVTTVTCSKKAKEFYTVVRNVKKAHQIQESGEFQEFNDDVEYILDALQDNNPISTRCLSAITLASKCMVPAFRMHVRAHGTVTKFFRALHDATKDQRLGMCTATVMFVLSQDRLNMDIDRDSLELMLNLLESDASHNQALEGCGLTDTELQKTKERVRSLCQEIQEQGHAKHLNLDNITVGQLAMETLLSLTSRRAGEWFKEELRDLGGLEHIIKTIVETCIPFSEPVVEWTPALLDRVKKADRCLRVVENVTLQNEENANYLLTYRDGVLVDTITRLFTVCDHNISVFPAPDVSDKNSTGAILKECLIANLKVLINLTHDFNNKAFGSALTGTKVGLIESSLHVLLEVPAYVPEEQKFDITVLALILLINLVEHCEENRRLLVNAKAPVGRQSNLKEPGGSAVSSLVELFMQQEELARTEERKTNAILDGEKTSESQKSEKSAEEFIEETVALLLQKAGRHMEHTLIGAYIALCLGYLTVDNTEFEIYVRSHMPENNYTMMLSVLQKFYDFMTLTAAVGSGSSRGLKATNMLIKHLTDLNNTIKEEPPSSPT